MGKERLRPTRHRFSSWISFLLLVNEITGNETNCPRFQTPHIPFHQRFVIIGEYLLNFNMNPGATASKRDRTLLRMSENENGTLAGLNDHNNLSLERTRERKNLPREEELCGLGCDPIGTDLPDHCEAGNLHTEHAGASTSKKDNVTKYPDFPERKGRRPRDLGRSISSSEPRGIVAATSSTAKMQLLNTSR